MCAIPCTCCVYAWVTCACCVSHGSVGILTPRTFSFHVALGTGHRACVSRLASSHLARSGRGRANRNVNAPMHPCTCARTCTHARMHMYMHTCTHAHVHAHMHMRMHTSRTHGRMYTTFVQQRFLSRYHHGRAGRGRGGRAAAAFYGSARSTR